MMRSTIALFLVFISTIGFTQKKEEIRRQEAIFNLAKTYHDGASARAALYQLITLEPEKEAWKDSLLHVYFSEGNYISTLLLAEELVKEKKDAAILERKAVAEHQLGLLKQALSSYEDLFKQEGDNHYLYQVATIQYQLKRFGECELTINALLNDPRTNALEVTVSLGNQQAQQVPMKAALLNIKGVLLNDIGKKEAAKQQFESALNVSPNFVLPKANLGGMNEVPVETENALDKK